MVLGERLGVGERVVVRWVRAPPALQGLLLSIRLHGVTGYCNGMAVGEAWTSARTARQRRPQPTSAPQARLDLLEVNPATNASMAMRRPQINSTRYQSADGSEFPTTGRLASL